MRRATRQPGPHSEPAPRSADLHGRVRGGTSGPLTWEGDVDEQSRVTLPIAKGDVGTSTDRREDDVRGDVAIASGRSVEVSDREIVPARPNNTILEERIPYRHFCHTGTCGRVDNRQGEL